MRRTLYFIVAIFLVSTSCLPSEKKAEKTGVKVAITPFLGEAATFIALEKGFFEQEGLAVELHKNRAGKHSFRQLLNEEVDIAHTSETPVSYGLLDSTYYVGNRQPDIVLFADMMFSNEIQKVIARRDKGISKPEDIIGKTVGYYQGTQSDYHLSSFLLEHQIPADSITTVHIAPEKQVEALKNGTIDVMVNWEPHPSNALSILADKAIELETRLTYSTLWLAIARREFAEQNTNILIKYLSALKKAQRYIDEHPKETVKVLSQNINVSEEVIREIRGQISYQLSLSERMLLILEDQNRWMNREEITTTKNYNFRKHIYTEPMQEVYPEGITIIR